VIIVNPDITPANGLSTLAIVVNQAWSTKVTLRQGEVRTILIPPSALLPDTAAGEGRNTVSVTGTGKALSRAQVIVSDGVQ
jgi:hypothetical protein